MKHALVNKLFDVCLKTGSKANAYVPSAHIPWITHRIMRNIYTVELLPQAIREVSTDISKGCFWELFRQSGK